MSFEREIAPNVDPITLNLAEGQEVRVFVSSDARFGCTAILDGPKGTLTGYRNGLENPDQPDLVALGQIIERARPNVFKVASGDPYELKVQAHQDGQFRLRVAGIELDVPDWLRGKLNHPFPFGLNVPLQSTSPEYGEVGSRWSNRLYPFYPEAETYIHLAFDIPVDEDVPVLALADGQVVKLGASGGEWGFHAGVRHVFETKKSGRDRFITVIYEHIKESGRPDSVGHIIRSGDVIGRIHPVNQLDGAEPNHLHLYGETVDLVTEPGSHIIRSAAGATDIDRLIASQQKNPGRFLNLGDPKAYKN